MMAAAQSLVVTISHRLGRDEAKRRIEDGLGKIRAEIAPFVQSLDYRWDAYRLDFRAAALLQTIAGRIEVFDDTIRIEIGLPLLLRLLGRTIAGRIEKRGATLLEGPQTKG
jgi:putative polyhydroxyalkanoic acid system protein